jgi:AcrR family transcriptional regulator
MGTIERRTREKDELRRKIMDAATALFLEEGYESVSMRKIADRIEYAPSTIYLHFRDKVDLVASICMEAFAELDRRLDTIIDTAPPPMTGLRQCLREYIHFGLDHPSYYIFVFCTPPNVFKDIDAASFDAIHTCAMGSFQRLRTGIQACMDTGGIPHGDVESASQSTWLFTHGVTSGLVVDCGFPFIEREQLIDESLDRILRSLA